MSISNYQPPYETWVTFKKRLKPYTYPKITKKAINYLKKNKISTEEFLDYVRLISINEGALMRTYAGINTTEPTGVYIDLFEWDECIEFEDCPRQHIMRDIRISVCFQGKTADEIVNSIFKLNSLLYKAYPNLNAYFTSEWDKK